jgi:hypothetical protein
MKVVASAIPSPKSSDFTEKNLQKTSVGRKVLKLIRKGIDKGILYYEDSVEKFLKFCAKDSKRGTCYGEATTIITTFTQDASEKTAVKTANKVDVMAFHILGIIDAETCNYFDIIETHKLDKGLHQKTKEFAATVIQTNRGLIEKKTKLKYEKTKKFSLHQNEKLFQWLKEKTQKINKAQVFRITMDVKDDDGHAVTLFLNPKKKISLYDAEAGFKRFDNQKDFLKHFKKQINDGESIVKEFAIDMFKAK